jgi:hypothetical protein
MVLYTFILIYIYTSLQICFITVLERLTKVTDRRLPDPEHSKEDNADRDIIPIKEKAIRPPKDNHTKPIKTHLYDLALEPFIFNNASRISSFAPPKAFRNKCSAEVSV